MRRLEGELYTYFVQVAPEKVKHLTSGWYLVKIENSVDTDLDRVGPLKHHVYRAFNAVKTRTVMTGLFYLSTDGVSVDGQQDSLQRAESFTSLDSPRHQPIPIDSEFKTPLLKPAVNPLGPFGSPFPGGKSFTLDGGGSDLDGASAVSGSAQSAKSLSSVKSIHSAAKSATNTEPLPIFGSLQGSRQLSGSWIAEGSQRGARSFPLEDLEDNLSPDSSPRENKVPSTKSTPRIGKAYTTSSEPLNRQPTMSLDSPIAAKSTPLKGDLPFADEMATSSVSAAGPSHLSNTMADEAYDDMDMSMEDGRSVSASDRTISIGSLPSEEDKDLALDSVPLLDVSSAANPTTSSPMEVEGQDQFRNPLRPALDLRRMVNAPQQDASPSGTPPRSPLKSGLAALLGERHTRGGDHVEYPSEVAVEATVKSFVPQEEAPTAGTEAKDPLDDSVSSDWPEFNMSPTATMSFRNALLPERMPASPLKAVSSPRSPRIAVMTPVATSLHAVETPSVSHTKVATPPTAPSNAVMPSFPVRHAFPSHAATSRSNIPAARNPLTDYQVGTLEDEQNFLINQFRADSLRQTYSSASPGVPPPAQSMLRPSSQTLAPPLVQVMRPLVSAQPPLHPSGSGPRSTGRSVVPAGTVVVPSARHSPPAEFSVSPLLLDE